MEIVLGFVAIALLAGAALLGYRIGSKRAAKARYDEGFAAGKKTGLGIVPDQVLEKEKNVPPGGYMTLGGVYDPVKKNHIAVIEFPDEIVRTIRMPQMPLPGPWSVNEKGKLRRLGSLPTVETSSGNGRGGHASSVDAASTARPAQTTSPSSSGPAGRRRGSRYAPHDPDAPPPKPHNPHVNGSGLGTAASAEIAPEPEIDAPLPPGHIRIE